MKYEINDYNVNHLFPTAIYSHNRSDFIPTVKNVFNEYISNSLKNTTRNPVYPAIMTDNMLPDERLENFIKYISDISWDILAKQGYNMDIFYTSIFELWGQNHPLSSSMDKHLHGYQSILSGFYFIDVPDNSCSIIIEDPRDVKVYASLPIKDEKSISNATNIVSFNPKPGDFYFLDSWLAHSFSRNMSQDHFNFIHFNIGVTYRDKNNTVEVV